MSELKIPKVVLDSRGRFKRLVPRVRGCFTCHKCGVELEWSGHYWVCPKRLDCSKAINDAEMLRRLLRVWEYRRWKPENLIRLRKRVCVWRNRAEARQAARPRRSSAPNATPT
jgi:hypothetical protein